MRPCFGSKSQTVIVATGFQTGKTIGNGFIGERTNPQPRKWFVTFQQPVNVAEDCFSFAFIKSCDKREGELEYSVPLTVGCEKYGNGEWQKLESDKSMLDDNLFKINGKIGGLLGAGIIYDFRAMVYDVFGPDVKGQGLLAFKADFECDVQKALSGELYNAFQDSKGELLFILGGGVGVVSQIPFTNLEWYWDNIWDVEFSIAKWPLLPDFKQMEAKWNNGNTLEIQYTLTSGNTLFKGQYGITLLNEQGAILTKQYYNSEPLKISELGTSVLVFTVSNVPKEALYVCPVYKLWGIEFVDYNSNFRLDGNDPDDPDIINGTAVVINGIKWATRNVDKPGTFADKPEDAGMFYQWNRKIGWSTTEPLVNSNGGTTWDSSVPTGTEWEKVNDPCPAGWRLPTRTELWTLIDDKVVLSERITVDNKVVGYKYTDKVSGKSLYLPYGGYRTEYGWLYSGGRYWSSTEYDNARARALDILWGSLSYTYYSRRNGMCVRCIAE